MAVPPAPRAVQQSGTVATIEVNRSIFPVPIRVRMEVNSKRKSEMRKKRSAGRVGATRK